MRKFITIRELYNKGGKPYNSNINIIKRKPRFNELMNNDTRIRIPYNPSNPYKLLLCIDYDPDKIIDTGISTTPEEAVSGRYLNYADRIKDIINENGLRAYVFEYIASKNRIDHVARTVMIIGLSDNNYRTSPPTNIYTIRNVDKGNFSDGTNLTVPRVLLREAYDGSLLEYAVNAFNTATIPPYMQPMVSYYSYSKQTYTLIPSFNNILSLEPWKSRINTLKWLRCLDISYIVDISSLAKGSTMITTDDGLEVFANHTLYDIESIFAGCSNLQKVSHMNNYILDADIYPSPADAVKSIFFACDNLTYIELLGWRVYDRMLYYLSMFATNGIGETFMFAPGKKYTLIIDEEMKWVLQTFCNSLVTTPSTEKTLAGLLENATPVNGIYTIIHEVPAA